MVGTRGDVQTFIGIGMKLKVYGHRVGGAQDQGGLNRCPGMRTIENFTASWAALSMSEASLLPKAYHPAADAAAAV